MAQTRNLAGWVRQRPDPRDCFLVHGRAVTATLPKSADLSAKMGPYLDQGNAGTCGPNTADEVVTFDEILQKLTLVGASRLHIYWWTRYIMGTLGSDSGVDNRSMMQALNKYGFCAEPLFPYSDTDQALNTPPPAAANQAAMANRITSYAAVLQQLDQMKATLAAAPGDPARPFIFGFDVFQQMMSDQAAETGILTAPSPGQTPIGGHDMTNCGYTDVDQPGNKSGNKWPAGTFRLRQHWTNPDGTRWGDDGYAYIPYDYATGSHASDFWVINAVPDVAPMPSPDPTPPSPAPTPVPGSDIKQKVDSIFAAVIGQFWMFPRVQQILREVQAEVDAALVSSGFTFFAPHHLGMGRIPVGVITIIDAAFTAAALAFPGQAPLINAARAVVDSLLPLV